MNSKTTSKPFHFHFWSSTEYSGFLAGLMRELGAHPDIVAEQRFTISEASYRSAHSWLARKWLRVRQYIIYPIHLILSLVFGKRADVVVVCTNTFFAPLLATFFHRRVVHLVYDLFPEALVHAGKMSGEGIAARFIHRLTQKTFDRAECNVFLGDRLLAYAAETYALKGNCSVIAVGADDRLFTATRSSSEGQGEATIADSGLTVLYCGNLGHMHDVNTLFRAWEKLKDATTPIQWRFQSVGPRHNALLNAVERLKGSSVNVSVGPGLPQAEWIRVMEESEVALVTMVPGSEDVVMPSKSYSALAAGQALLAVAPASSDLVAMIEAHQCGWWIEPGDVAGLVRVIDEIAADPAEVQTRRVNARRAAREHYSQRALAKQWLAVVGGR